eukprot:scaffold27889_cov67-Phaeocystis_antarctica.AAC.3
MVKLIPAKEHSENYGQCAPRTTRSPAHHSPQPRHHASPLTAGFTDSSAPAPLTAQLRTAQLLRNAQLRTAQLLRNAQLRTAQLLTAQLHGAVLSTSPTQLPSEPQLNSQP